MRCVQRSILIISLALPGLTLSAAAFGLPEASQASPVPAESAPRAASLLAFSSDASLLACSNRDSGTVTILSWPDLKKLQEVSVGLHPEGIAFLPGSHRLACCVYGDDRIAIIDADQGIVERQIEVFDEPYGVVAAADGSRLFATLEYPGEVVCIDVETGAQLAAWKAGQMVRGLAITADDSALLVTEYLTARVVKISTGTGEVMQVWEPASTDNLCRQVVISPTGNNAWITHIRSRVSAAHGNGSIFPYVTAVRLSEESAGKRVRLPMDTFRGARVTANPWDCDVSSDGARLCVVFAGTNDMYVARVVEDQFQELEYEATVRTGNNPRAVKFAPGDQSVVVYNALDFEVVVHALPDGTELRRAEVTKNPLSEQLLLGKKLFYTALQPMSSRQWISCSSCHPDSDSDGRTWQQPEGLRNTQSLQGLKHTHPLHWSADRDEVHDFEHTIRGPLMQGRGLLNGSLPEALGEAITGRSEALDALAAYTNSHGVSLSPHARGGLSESAKRGQVLFHSERTGCATCHSGPWYTDSRPGPSNQLIRHDVGTGRSDKSELMGFAYDTPTLLGVYRTAPYLHDGSAPTLEEVLTTQNADDLHGRTSGLSSAERQDLIEFLKALPFEQPPEPPRSGITSIGGAQ